MVKEGYQFAAPPLVLSIMALLIHWLWTGAVLLFLAAFVLYFFRDPERAAPADPSAVVSPADGRVMEVVEEPLGSRPGRRISIFLAIWDVHVNRPRSPAASGRWSIAGDGFTQPCARAP